METKELAELLHSALGNAVQEDLDGGVSVDIRLQIWGILRLIPKSHKKKLDIDEVAKRILPLKKEEAIDFQTLDKIRSALREDRSLRTIRTITVKAAARRFSL